MSKLIEFYRSVFTLIGVTVADNGAVEVFDGHSNTPFTIKGKALYLPVDEALRAKPGTTYNFHPLLEDVVRNESIILTEYRRSAMALANLNLVGMVGDLLRIAASDDLQKGLLDPNQHEITSVLKGASEITIKAFDKLLGSFPETPDVHCKLVKMNIRKNGKYNEQNVRALAVITSPFLDALKENAANIPEKHIKIIRAAVLYVLPGIDVDGTWNCGSNSQYAPMFHATLAGLFRLYKRAVELDTFFKSAKIGDLVKATAEFDVESIVPYIDGHEEFDQLRTEAKRIPMQIGNEGQSADGAANAVVETPAEKRRNVTAALSSVAKVEPIPVEEPKKMALPTSYREETAATPEPVASNKPRKFGSYAEAVHRDAHQPAPGQPVRRDEYGNILNPETNLPYGVTVEEIVPRDPRERSYLIYLKNGVEVDPDNNYRPIRNRGRGRYDDDRDYDRRGRGRYDDDRRGRYDDDRRGRGRYDDRDYDRDYDRRDRCQNANDIVTNGRSINYFDSIGENESFRRRR